MGGIGLEAGAVVPYRELCALVVRLPVDADPSAGAAGVDGVGHQVHEDLHDLVGVAAQTADALDVHLEVSLREVMFAEPGSAVGELIHQTGYAQPALFAMGVALHAVFVEAGITPEFLLGHSIGELTAAYLAGVMAYRRDDPPPIAPAALGDDGPIAGAAEEAWSALLLTLG